MTDLGRWLRSWSHSVGLFAAASIAGNLILSGCVIPLPKNNEGIADEQLLKLKQGETSRMEVVAALGEPDIVWETENVIVYDEGPSGSLLWIIPGNYSAAIFLTELGEDVVIMRFDEADRIERLERRTGPIDGDFLRGWLAEK